MANRIPLLEAEMAAKLSDLTDMLYRQLNKLGSEAFSPEQLQQEISRTEAIVEVSDQIIKVATTQIAAAKLFAEHGGSVLTLLPVIGNAKAEDSSK